MVTLLDRYATADEVNEPRGRLELHVIEWADLNGQDEYDRTPSLLHVDQEWYTIPMYSGDRRT